MPNFLCSMTDRLAYVSGILSKRFVYQGPPFLEIHLTNTCNLNCTGCYCHSALKPDRYLKDWHKIKLDKDMFYQIINEAVKLKIRNIIFSGDGEPFTHPEIAPFIKYIKERGIYCKIITNGTLIDKRVLQDLSLSRLDSLVLSLWDHDPKRYEVFRPGHGDKLNRIKEWLAYYRDNKKKSTLPDVQVLFLINSKNFNKIQEMYDFAETYKVDKCNFALLKIYKDVTEDYMMNEEQVEVAFGQLKQLSKIKGGVASNAKDFCRVLEFVKTKEHKYISNFIKNMPCYLGWIYTIVLINGDVVPCCGCKEYVLGNIQQKTLSDIWLSKEYAEFRYRVLTDKSAMPFNCNCNTACSQYQINLNLNNFLKFFL